MADVFVAHAKNEMDNCHGDKDIKNIEEPHSVRDVWIRYERTENKTRTENGERETKHEKVKIDLTGWVLPQHKNPHGNHENSEERISAERNEKLCSNHRLPTCICAARTYKMFNAVSNVERICECFNHKIECTQIFCFLLIFFRTEIGKNNDRYIFSCRSLFQLTQYLKAIYPGQNEVEE